MTRAILALAAVLCTGVGVASAQTAPVSKFFVVVNGGGPLRSNDFTDGAIRRENAEDGRFDTEYTLEPGADFDIAGGGIVWRQLAVGVGVSRFSAGMYASLRATSPHPFFFNQARSVSGAVTGLQRKEIAIDMQIRRTFPVLDRFQVMVFGGPSFLHVTQGLITDFTYTEQYPYDTATFSEATTNDVGVWTMGFHGGVDGAYFFTNEIGVGATLVYRGASVRFPVAGRATQSIKVGGPRAGGGLRLRF